MRILQVNSARGWSGGQAQVLFLTRGLLERGHEVIVACPAESELAKRSSACGIPVEPVPMRSEADIPSVVRLYRLMRKHRIQIVNAHKPQPFTLASPAASLARVPVVVYSRRVSFPLGRNIISRWKWRSFKLDGIVAVSQRIRDELIEFGYPPDRIEVIYSATDTDRFAPGVDGSGIRAELDLPEGARLITKVANHLEWKGHFVFMDAAERICRLRDDVYFLVVGNETSFTSRMRERLERSDMKGRFFIWGYREDVPEIIAASNITVNASVAGEGLAGVLRESLAMKVPVISTKVGGNPELVEHERTGLLVDSDDAEALADAIVRLLDDAELAASLAQAGHELVSKRFSIDAMVSQTEAFYERLLASR